MEQLSLNKQGCEYIYTAQDIELIFFKGLEYDQNEIPDITEFKYHTHEWYEMFYSEQEDVIIHIDGEAHSLHSGDFIIINPGTFHYLKTTGTAAFTLQFLCRYTTNSVHANKFPWRHLLNTAPYKHIKGNEELLALVTFLKNAIESEHNPSIGSYLYTLLTRMDYLQENTVTDYNAVLYDSNAGRIYILDQLFFLYFSTDISLSDFARELHISNRQLSRIIQQQYGCSFREKIISLRIQQAKLLLSQGWSTSDTAHKVGYSSVEAFRTIFASSLGITPAEFRRQNSSNDFRQ